MHSLTTNCLIMSRRVSKKWRMMKTIPCAKQFSTRSRRAQMTFSTAHNQKRKALLVGSRSWAAKLCSWKWCQKWQRVVILGPLLSHQQVTYNLQLIVHTIREKWLMKVMPRDLHFTHDNSPQNNGHLPTFSQALLAPLQIRQGKNSLRGSNSTWLLTRSSSQGHTHRTILQTQDNRYQHQQDLTRNHCYKCSRTKVLPKSASKQLSAITTRLQLQNRIIKVLWSSITQYLRLPLLQRLP